MIQDRYPGPAGMRWHASGALCVSTPISVGTSPSFCPASSDSFCLLKSNLTCACSVAFVVGSLSFFPVPLGLGKEGQTAPWNNECSEPFLHLLSSKDLRSLAPCKN